MVRTGAAAPAIEAPADEPAVAEAPADAEAAAAPLVPLTLPEIDWSRFPAVRKLLERWGMLPPGSHQTDVFERLGVGIEKVALRSRRRVAATAGQDGESRWRARDASRSVRHRDAELGAAIGGRRGIAAIDQNRLHVTRELFKRPCGELPSERFQFR